MVDDTTDDAMTIEVQAITRGHANGMLPEEASLIPGKVWCKMKSAEGVKLITDTMLSAEEVTCASLNQKAFDTALSALADDISPAAINFGEDTAYETGLDWLMTGVVHVSDEGLHSPTLIVGNNESLPEVFRNVVYCKLWSPARALYYLMTGR